MTSPSLDWLQVGWPVNRPIRRQTTRLLR